MNVYKNIAVLLIFLLFGMNNACSAMNQAMHFPLIIAATHDVQGHSHSHDCSSDGDDVLSHLFDGSMNPCFINSDLINLYNGNAPSGVFDLIWQPPKKQIFFLAY